jgi:hypothetical protein
MMLTICCQFVELNFNSIQIITEYLSHMSIHGMIQFISSPSAAPNITCARAVDFMIPEDYYIIESSKNNKCDHLVNVETAHPCLLIQHKMYTYGPDLIYTTKIQIT